MFHTRTTSPGHYWAGCGSGRGQDQRAAGRGMEQSCTTLSLHTTGRDGLSVNSWLSPNRKQSDGRNKPSPYNQTSPRLPYAVCPLMRTQPHSFGIHSSLSRPSCFSPWPYWGKDGPTTYKQIPGDQGKGAWEPEAPQQRVWWQMALTCCRRSTAAQPSLPGHGCHQSKGGGASSSRCSLPGLRNSESDDLHLSDQPTGQRPASWSSKSLVDYFH